MNAQFLNLPLEEWSNWLQHVMQPAALKQLAVIIGTAGLAWLAVHLLRRAVLAGRKKDGTPDAAGGMMQRSAQRKDSLLFGAKNYDGVLFPCIWLGFTYLAAQYYEIGRASCRERV